MEAIIQSNRSLKCLHCGTAFRGDAESELFCCAGCELVHSFIRSSGLESFYRLRDANPPECPLPAQVSSESYEHCDDPEFIKKASRDGRSLRFYLEGISCTACLWLLEKLPSLCADAESVRVDMSNSTAEVVRTPQGSFAAIARSLNRLGHRPHALGNLDTVKNLRRKEDRRELTRIGIAAFSTGNIMILAVSLYSGADGVLADRFRLLSTLLALPVLTFCSWPFYVSAFSALRSRHLNIDVPIVSALIAGSLMSFWGLFSGHDTVYFDSLSTLVLLLSSSRYWLRRMHERHLDLSHLEDELLVGTITRLQPEGTRERISTLSLRRGDEIEITGEMTIPADGVALSGTGEIHTAALTGETDVLRVEQGALIEAGSRNLSGTWTMHVRKSAGESRLAQIMRDAGRAAESKPAIIGLSDLVARWFVGLVLVTAVAIVVYFSPSDLQEGFSRALALVIVTCPCVFGMAIPLSMSLAIRGAARKGMVIKNAEVLERCRKIQTICFDKTGTLTTGELRVLNIRREDSCTDDHLVAARALESEQTHPVAKAIISALGKKHARLEAENISPTRGGGVCGRIGGRDYSLCPLGEGSVSGSEIRANYGFFLGEKRLATFEVGDSIRPGGLAVIRWLRGQGYGVKLISGDRMSVVNHYAERLGFLPNEVVSEASPEAKAALLKSSGGQAAMIGDGANDAAALASAAIGIAVRGSMDVSLRAADVYLLRPDLRGIKQLFLIARKTRAAILRNLIFSAGFNAVSGLLAISGHMNPLFAAVLMPLSSMIVLMSALYTGRRILMKGDA